MNDYIITTENTADLPDSYLKEHDIRIMYLPCIINGVTYDDKNPLDSDEFYRTMRAGTMPTTSQVNREEAKAYFEQFLKVSKNILHVSFSSGLSGTANNVASVAQEIMEEQPDCKIVVVDSLCASLGQGLLAHKAMELREQGKSLEENAAWLEEHKLNIVHNFTVDDLFHLHRGGRVSKTAAIVGSMINLKPILHVDDEGHLIPVGKVRGRKKSIMALAENMEKQIGSWKDKNDIVFISHGDCLEDAESLKEIIRRKMGIEAYLINVISPTIAAHSGPGTLALFYMGDVR